MISSAAVKRGVAAIVKGASKEVEDLAERYRGAILIPFCRKHRLEFLSGNGTWYFDRGGASLTVDELPALAEIEAILSVAVFGKDDLFGFYVCDVRRKIEGSL